MVRFPPFPFVTVVWLLSACSRGGELGARLELAVAPLTLPGVGKVCYDLKLTNAAAAAGDVVWTVGDPSSDADPDALCSTSFGNGTGGDITYVGACDASSSGGTGRTNSVTLWVDGLFDEGGTAIAENGANGWQDPCPTGCTLEVVCQENADARVEFNLSILRQANQGFFDIGVNFEDIFCSAKVDCRDDVGSAMKLLFRPGTSTRDTTIVSALACTAGPGSNAPTALYRDPIVVSCDGVTSTLPMTTDRGNRYGVDPNLADAIWQYAVYAGEEKLNCGAASCNKIFWNIALGLDESVDNCVLTTRMTASRDGAMPALTTPSATTYPYIDVNVPLTNATGLACNKHPLNGADGRVKTVYTTLTSPVTFTTKLTTLVDECATNVDDCSPNATCTDTAAAFTCACNAGYTGDGKTCTDIDECTLGTDDCHVNATCTNTAGSFSCQCLPGLSGDGRTCSCASGTDNCNGSAADGCETVLASSHEHCGACNNPCANDEICSSGACIKPCTAAAAALSYTGANQTVTVPSGCNTAEVKVWGAGGGGENGTGANGGAGGFVSAKLTVSASASLTAVVGGGGGTATLVDGPGGAGGFGGGGRGGTGAGSFRQGGGGGGYSGLFLGAVSQANALVLAGGGGGSGHSFWTRGGGGGGTNGVAATNNGICYAVIGAGGGTQSAGGQPTSILTGGMWNIGSAGSALTGGVGGNAYAQWGGGGGGGGYFGGAGGNGDNGWNSCDWGGGGAAGSSGGGGSGFIKAAIASDVLSLSGTRAGNPAFNKDPDYVAGIGLAGLTGADVGGHGRIVIRWAYRHTLPVTSIPADAEASAFITATSISSASEITAIQRLVYDLKQAGLWSKFQAIYPMVGGTEARHKLNLKDPRDIDAAFRIAFLGGGWTHSATGAKPNGTTSYADTKLSASASLTPFSTHLAYYSRTSERASSNIDMGSYSGSGGNLFGLVIARSGNGVSSSIQYEQYTGSNSAISTVIPNASGFWLGNRTSNVATTHQLWLNGAAIAAASSTAGSLPSQNVYIGALPNGASPLYFSAKEIGFASIGAGLSESEAMAYYVIVQRFNTTLGRQIGDPVL